MNNPLENIGLLEYTFEYLAQGLDMESQNTPKLALKYAFPSLESWKAWLKEGSAEEKKQIIVWAADKEVLSDSTESSWEDFLINSDRPEQCVRATLATSLRGQIDKIVATLRIPKNAQLFKGIRKYLKDLGIADFPDNQVNKMEEGNIHRSPRKKEFLRALSFWIGLTRPNLGLDYDNFIKIAEGVGFEPTDRYKRSTVFKTVAFNHSAIPPKESYNRLTYPHIFFKPSVIDKNYCYPNPSG